MLFLARTGGAFAMLLAAFPISLPAQDGLHSTPMVLIHDRPYVDVMVNGKGPFRFVIDTGTGGQALVSPELADELNLPSAGEVRLNDPSGQGGRREPVVRIQTLEVAGVEFTEVKAVRHMISGAPESCQGLLGFTLFRDYLLTLDYPNRRMSLASGSLTPDHEQAVLPLRMPDGIPIVSLEIGDFRIDAQIDSGGDGLSLPEQSVRRLKFAVDPVDFALGQTLSSRFQVKAAKLASNVRLGEYTFPRPFVEIHPAFPLANFGSCPMQDFALTFDQKNLLVRFEAVRKTLNLSATPMAIRLTNAPLPRTPGPPLVPTG
jgi:predicted aspartyl protease